jgi:serine phosphatase RsbU (regulator of sigma subunit)/Tfp pilus assembly protein PilF
MTRQMTSKKTHCFCLTLPLFISLLMLVPFASTAQNPHLDSLLNVLKTMKEDTSKINTLNELSRAFLFEANDNVQSLAFIDQQLALSKKLNFKKGLAFGYTNMAIFHTNKSDFKIALEYNKLSLKLMQEIGHKKGESSCYINIGQNYSNLGNYTSAISNMLQGVKIKEEIDDKRGVAVGYGNIGSIFVVQEKYEEALKYYLRSLKIKEEINDKPGMAMSYNNIGSIFFAQKKIDDALIYFEKSLKLKKELGNKKGTATTYSNIGEIYLAQNKMNLAFSFQLKSLEIATESKDKKGMLTAYSCIGSILEKKKKYGEAIVYYNKMLVLAKESDLKEGIMTGYKGLAEVYKASHNFDSALVYRSLYYEVKDTLFNKENFKQLAELNTRFETDKKEKEILLLTKDQELNAKIIKQQQLVRWGLIGGLGLLFISIITIYRRYRFKQKAYLILELQKEEIQQKNILITDSIDYAKTIQEAVLPTPSSIKNLLPDSFILYKPKAIVSGDFYWLHTGNDQLICAVADCRGQGVPGAFMSLLGYNMLEDVVKTSTTFAPGNLLNGLHQQVMTRLSGKDTVETIKQEMNISLICIDQLNNRLQFAGAYHPLYIVRGNDLIELQADPWSIGTDKKHDYSFRTQTCSLEKGDMIYLFTDGFPNQIGGASQTTYNYHSFKEYLCAISSLEPDQQKIKLEQTHASWMGEKLDQTDDILIMGIRFK